MSKYFLSSKNLGQRFADYKGKAVRLALEAKPHTVDEVIVGIKGTNNTKKITTFRDSNGKIIERVFDYFDKPYRNRIYKNADYKIGEDQLVNSTTIKEYFLPRYKMKVYKEFQKMYEKREIPTTMWDHQNTVTNHVSTDVHSGKKVLSQVKVEKTDAPQEELHSFIEYPHIRNNKKVNNDRKSLTYKVDRTQDEIVKGSIIAQGVEAPQKDTFLRYRAVDVDTMKEPITQRCIKERKLEDIGIKINPRYTPTAEEENITAKYVDFDGSVNFNKKYKFKSKSKLIETAKHEVEHAWQYFLNALFTGGKTPRTKKIAHKYGKPQTEALRQEAKRYTEAIKNYTPHNVDFEKYRNNYIEVEARKAGSTARKKYDRQRTELKKAFPHIPEEVL